MKKIIGLFLITSFAAVAWAGSDKVDFPSHPFKSSDDTYTVHCTVSALDPTDSDLGTAIVRVDHAKANGFCLSSSPWNFQSGIGESEPVVVTRDGEVSIPAVVLQQAYFTINKNARVDGSFFVQADKVKVTCNTGPGVNLQLFGKGLQDC